MERSRRNQQSEDKRSTSLLIQQLAAARERKLQGNSAANSRTLHLLEDCEPESPASRCSDEGVEDAGIAITHSTSSSTRGHATQIQRSRLLGQPHPDPIAKQKVPDSDEIDDLADMIQGFGLSATNGSAPPQQQKQYRFPSSRSDFSTNSTNSRHLHSTAVASNSKQVNQQPQTATVDLTVAEAAPDDDDGCNGDDHVSASTASTAAPAPAAASPPEDPRDNNDSDDDSFVAHIPRGRKPAGSAAAAPATSEAPIAQKHSTNSSSSSTAHYCGDSSDDDSCGDPVPPRSGPAGVQHSSNLNKHQGATSNTASSSSSSSSSGDTGSSSIRPYLTKKPAAAAAEVPEGSLVLDGGFCLDAKIADKLYPHQVLGVKWLWSLHKMRKGGILADDMGLGKTMQCSAFLAGSLRSSCAVRALVVAPKTLLAHWEKELRVCGMAARTHSFYGSSEGERAAALRTLTGRGGVMLTTYGMVLHNAAQIRMGLGPVARDVDEHEDEIDLLCPDPPPGRRILWDYIILDEGHKIKNSRTQLAQRLRELRATTRVIISGTPVQNNLSELHSLLEFAVPGLLGGLKEFKLVYEKAITAGQDRDAALRVRELGAAKAAELRKIVAPFMLRREKKEVLGDGSTAAEVSSTAAAASSSKGAAGPAPMGSKHDLVVWLRLQPLQRHIYEAFLHSDAVKAALNSTRSPLAALTVLKKVCDHPALLSERATNLVLSAASKPHKKSSKGRSSSSSKQQQRRNSMDDFIVDDDDDDDYNDENSGSSSSSEEYYSDEDGSSSSRGYRSADPTSKGGRSRAAVAAELDNAGFSDEFISWAESEGLESRLLGDIGKRGTEASCKSLFVTGLLEQLVAEGHRTLVFSQSRVMLDILQAAVVAHGWSFCRIDGTIASTDARQAEVDRFQAPAAKIPVFLLTTQVGGLGLTLTAANRVVIVDPSWNPATDNQSVDRAYRIGQSRDVIVYRLVTCGTVEEKIYRKQVFKGGLSRAGMEEGVQLRYFTHQELHELFKWDPAALNSSETQQLLAQQHSQHTQHTLQQNPSLAQHVGWVETSPHCAGTSEHGLLFSELDPEGKTLQLQRPEYLKDNRTQQGSAEQWNPSRGGKGVKGSFTAVSGAAAAGPSAAEISTMLATLNIANTSSSGSSSSSGKAGALGLSTITAAAGGQGAAAAAPAAAAGHEREVLESRVKDLELSLRKVTADVNRLAGRLPDGGAKLQARQAELQSALAASRAQLQQLLPHKQQPTVVQSNAGSISTAAAAAGGDRQYALVDITNGTTGTAAAVDDHHHQQHSKYLQLPLLPPHPLHQQQQQTPAMQLGQQLLLQQPQQSALPLQAPQQQQQQKQKPLPRQHQQQQGWYGQPPPPTPPRPQQQQQQQQLGSLLLNQKQPCYHTPAVSSAAAAANGHQLGTTTHQYSSSSNSSSKPVGDPSPFQSSTSRTTPAATAAAAAAAGAGGKSGKMAADDASLPAGIKAETLDGRVPTLAQLKQRKHVLKKALQQEEQLKSGLSAQGQKYPQQRQQQWVAMYEEYKEIKKLLQQAEETRTAAAAAAGGGERADRGVGRSSRPVESIDLT